MINNKLKSLIGEKVTLLCNNYFYTGKLIEVDEFCVMLENPAIIFEMGSLQDDNYQNLQEIKSQKFYVQISSIESFGLLK